MSQDTTAPEPFFARIQSFNQVFWIMNAMEMLERLAYYGVRTVVPTYMVLSIAEGGPEFTHIQKGAIFGWWALVQSVLPMFTGGYADRYGYKPTIAVAIGLKVIGYLMMAHLKSYEGFLAGCLMLAAGTAVFKPGVQGTLASVISEKNASLGWGIFYQIVNIGGFFGPILAGWLRLMDWQWVFYSCAVIVSLNLLALVTFEEPSKKAGRPVDERTAFQIFWQSIAGMFQPRLLAFILLFSGFWLMFNQIFDILPNFLDDWVDSSALWGVWAATGLPGAESAAKFAAAQRPFNQEWIINLNPGLIILLMVPIADLTGRLTPLRSILVGIAIASLGTVLVGASMSIWACIGAILIFSVGEMASSPKKLEYLASLAKPGQQGLYMGYANMPLAFGWFAGSRLGGWLYETTGDRTNLARRHLVEKLGHSPELVDALPKDDVLPALIAASGQPRAAVIQTLWDTYSPGQMWYWFAAIGLGSLLGLAIYDRVLRQLDAKEAR